jgi:hypothetical protein
MAELTEAEYVQIIIAEVGDDTQANLAAMVPLYWRRRDGVTDLETRALYVKRDAIVLLLGKVRAHIDLTGTGGASIKQDQLTTHLQALFDQVHGQITQIESSGRAGVVAKTMGITNESRW